MKKAMFYLCSTFVFLFMGTYTLFRPNLAHTSPTPIKETYQLQLNDIAKKYSSNKNRKDFRMAILDYNKMDTFILEDLLYSIHTEQQAKNQISEQRIKRLELLSDAILTVIISRTVKDL